MQNDASTHNIVCDISKQYVSSLKIAHINVQSLMDSDHFSEFCSLFGDSEFDIIAISETFLKPSITDSAVNLPGYFVYRKDRKVKRGGGVAVYVRDSLKCKILPCAPRKADHKYDFTPEYLLLEISFLSTKLLFSCIYRAPKIGFMDLFVNDMYSHLLHYKYVIIAGDMNARFGSNSFESENIDDVLNMCNLTRIPYSNTFHTAISDSNLDVIASNCHSLLQQFGQCPASGFSNHDLIYAVFSLNVPKYTPKLITYRDFSKFDSDAFIADANDITWHVIVETNDIDEKVDVFSSLLTGLYDKHAPLKTVRAKHPPVPWMTVDIKRLIKDRDLARRRHIKTKHLDDYEAYRILRNRTKQSIRNAKIKFTHNLFNTSKSPSTLWSAVRSLGIGKESRLTTDVSVTAESLNTHFSSVARVTDPERIKNVIDRYKSLPRPDREAFHFSHVYPKDIINAVRNIKSKAKGPDNISITLIQKCIYTTLPSILHIFNFSLQSGVFPTQWKMAHVKPIPKTSKPASCSDFRPISLLCVLSKILEKIVNDQLQAYLSTHNILSTFQSGFRKGHNTTTSLVKVTDDIRFAMDRKEVTLLTLFDFSKAFDCVHHELLLTKLANIGVAELAIRWFSSYLSNRCQQVVFNNSISSWIDMSIGVPQGSVLGPLMFSIYINDISASFEHSSHHMYADDLQMYKHFLSKDAAHAIDCINSDISNLVTYSEDHNLTLNVSKTQLILIGYKKLLSKMDKTLLPPVTIIDSVIPYQQSVKNLGIIMDETLSWNQHVNTLTKKVVSSMHQIKRNCPFLPHTVRKVIIQALIFPIIDYASIVYNDLSETLNIKLQRVQNACVRFIADVRRDEHITPHYIKLKWLKLVDRRTLSIAILISKIMKSQCPSYLFQSFTRMGSIHNRLNRHTSNTVQIPKHRTVKCNKSFIITASRLWNKYLLQTYSKNSTAMLKSKIHQILLSGYH